MSLWQKLSTPGSGAAATLTPEPTHSETPAADAPPGDLITPENVTAPLIKAVFDAAFMDASIDDDGDVLVKDAVKVFIRIGENKERLRMFCIFSFKDFASTEAQLRCANLINTEYIVVTAAVMNNKLLFRFDVLLGTGISKKYLVQALKRFASIPQSAVNDHGREIVQ